MRIQSPRMDSRRSWLSAKPNVTVKREVPSDSAKLNGLGAPEEHSQSAHAVVAQLRSVRSDNLGGRHCAPKSKTLNYWQDGKSHVSVCARRSNYQKGIATSLGCWSGQISQSDLVIILSDRHWCTVGGAFTSSTHLVAQRGWIGCSHGHWQIECSYTLWWLSRSLPCG